MKKRVLCVGLGNMGMSHALAYTRIPGFEVVGVCTRHIANKKLPEALDGAKRYSNYDEALAELKPDVVSDQHAARHACRLLHQGDGGGRACLCRKAARRSVAQAEKVVDTARRTGKKLVVGYILRQHPSWIKFIEIARQLGTPLVFRMNLNQQSNGETWDWHKRLMDSFPADRRLRRPLCRRHVPDDAGQAGPRPCDRRAPHQRGAGLQLRRAAGRLRGRLRRLVRGGLGPDDERDRLLREGRHRPEGLRLDRHGRDGRQREVRRHQRPHKDQPDPLAPRRHDAARRAHRHDGRARPRRRSASASSAIC